MPIDIDVISSEWKDNDPAWIIVGPQDRELWWPHDNYPGIQVYPMFVSENDATDMLARIPADAPAKRHALHIKRVNLLSYARSISARRNGGERVGFVVLSPNDVFDFL